MKTTNTLRILAGLSFLIFFCPFFQTCSNDSLKDAVVQMTPDLKPKWDKMSESEKLEYKQKLYTDNAYTIFGSYAKGVFTNRVDMHEKDTWQEPFFYGMLLFIFTMVTALAILITGLLGKYKAAFILAAINILFIIAHTIVIVLPHSLVEELHQIKFGYYLFVLNSIVLVYFSHKASKNTLKLAAA